MAFIALNQRANRPWSIPSHHDGKVGKLLLDVRYPLHCMLQVEIQSRRARSQIGSVRLDA